MAREVGVVIFKGRRLFDRRLLFQILLTGSRVLNILFYYPIKSTSNNLYMGFISVRNLVP